MAKTYFDVAVATTKGARDCQEDAVVASFPRGQAFGFAVLADGIGGPGVGDTASAVATTVMYSHLKMQEAKLDSGSLDLGFALRTAAERVNASISTHLKRGPDTAGMATTMLVPVIRGDRLSWFSIGNCALFLMRGGALRKINKEHSLSSELAFVMQGAAKGVRSGRKRAPSVPVLNGTDIVGAECTETPILLKQGDVLLAATDGLQTLTHDAVAAVLASRADERSADIADALLEAVEAERQPDQDNASFVVVRMDAVSRADAVIDLDDMPVLAQAGAAAPATAPEPEPARDESKAFYYRGQKYYRD